MGRRADVPGRVGTTVVSNEGYIMTCTVYKTYSNIRIKFEHGCEITTTWGNFSKGQVKNPYHKSVVDVGYFGEGIYKGRGKDNKAYATWSYMLRRCYSEEHLSRDPSYRGCYVDKTWHNYQNFCKWFYDNYYEVDGEKMNLDKDILIKGNKVYAPSTCIFVPERLNKLIIKSDSIRGVLPIGVSQTREGKYVATMKNKNTKEYLGVFETPEEAFSTYKVEKEKYIKEIADEYKDKIPSKLYEAFLGYEVHIDD